MKIKKTSGSGRTNQAARTPGSAPTAKQDKVQETQSVGDVVTLSSDAVSAAGVQEIQEVSTETTADGPLPDPRATSKAILEKELAAVFRETYL